jgi:hypothetical protein
MQPNPASANNDNVSRKEYFEELAIARMVMSQSKIGFRKL